jgi:outer membrane lipoprotein-sorting protein
MLSKISDLSSLTKFKNTIFFILLLLYNASPASIDDLLIKKIQANLSKMDRVAIEFEQIDKKNTAAEGRLLIQKPYLFRCNYYPPYPILIVGGKKYVSIYDYDMETLTRVDAKENILNILFQNNWTDNKNFTVTNTLELDKYFIVEILSLENQQKSEIYFDKKSLNISKLNIFEMDELSISIHFSRPVFLKKFKPGLFEIRDPSIFGKPLHLGKDELSEHYH